jgi:hypothetical protein
MSRRRKPGRPARATAREWQPLEPDVAVMRSPEQEAAVRAECERRGVDYDATITQEMWSNDRYVCHVRRFDSGAVAHISYRRQDRKPARDWRDAQRIKNELAGEHTWAMEVYPDEDHLVDGANQYHLWCLPPGVVPPFGFHQGREVGTAEQAAAIGAVQR